ncbi:hypothetical protein N510_001399 [Firmicutes bacterium ASF500]|nr:hypothetical protein N510_001399 [Firmicutes bacterium ASF500]
MNSEHLLDAIGLLDDGLIHEAEEYRRPRRDYSRWISPAASLAVVLTLGYGLTHLGIGGGGGASAPGGVTGAAGADTPAASAPAEPPTSTEGMDQSGGAPDLVEPGASGDWSLALRVDGVVYWATNEYVHLEPEESDIRCTTSFLNGAEPEEDGQANFLPVGSPYVLLDDGTAAVLEDEETNSWRLYDSIPPWEK